MTSASVMVPPTASLVLPILLKPILNQLEERGATASHPLRAALCKAEAAHPGLAFELVQGIMAKADLDLNMNESLLRLQSNLSDHDGAELRVNRTEEPFQELNKKSMSLKKILSRIPDEITDRKTFLETIKDIASAIKKLLDAVNEIAAFIGTTSGKQALEQRKRDFVKYSKRFSNTLKEYFREGQPAPVYLAATNLIFQTNQVMVTVKKQCE